MLPVASATLAREAALRERFPGCMVMSARREGDVANLDAAIRAFFQKDLIEADLFLPWTAQQARGEIFANCQVLEERGDGEGTFFHVRGEADAVNSLRERFGQAQ